MIPLSERRTLVLHPTQQCNAACDHCATFSSPKTMTSLESGLVSAAIRQASDAGFTHIVFSGGEVTLTGKRLLDGIRLAVGLGLKTQMVTNGWWAKTEKAARRHATNFSEAGLTEINFSTGDQHARFVPVASIVRGVCACVRANIPVTVIVEMVDERSIRRETIAADPNILSVRSEFPERQLSIYQSPWMPTTPDEQHVYPPGVAVNKQNLNTRGGCDEVIQTLTVGPDGGVTACCGVGVTRIPELKIGDVRDITVGEAAEKAMESPLYWRLRNEGPEHMLAAAAEVDPTIEWENRYGHRCQACMRLFSDEKVRNVVLGHETESKHGDRDDS